MKHKQQPLTLEHAFLLNTKATQANEPSKTAMLLSTALIPQPYNQSTCFTS